MKKLNLLASTTLGSAAMATLAFVATPAFAQETPAPDQTATTVPATVPETQQATPAEDTGGIVVTGSRIRRSTFNSPSPIAVIDPEQAEKRGVIDTAEMLMSSPIASGSSQVTSAISSNFVTDGGPGASTISLRGLGANRTLVLLNGRRAGPAGTRGAVSAFDLNVLPQSIIQQVQIEKDGASSVYGSDAVAGVVNLLTKTKTEGLELNAFGSATEGGGGDQYRISGAWGTEWGGSMGGHVMFAADYYKQTELAAGDRDYLSCPEDYVYNSANQRTDLVNPVTGKPRCSQLSWGQVYLYSYNAAGTALVGSGRGGFSYPGENLGNYVPNLRPSLAATGFGVPGNFYQMGYDPASGSIDHLYSPIYGQDTVIPETKRLTFYGDASIHLGEHVEAYAEGLWNRRESKQNGSRQFWNYMYTEDWGGPATGFTGNGFISPTPITDHFDSSQRVDYWRAVGGLRGDFGSFLKGWTWDGYVQYSKSVGTYTQDQIYQDAIDQQSWRFDACQPGEVTAVRGAPCVDVRWTDPEFLAGAPNAAERAYLFGVDTGKTVYKQLAAEFSVTGPIVTLPAGDLAVAAGVAWRRDSINDRPGDIVCGEVVGDPYGCENNAWGVTTSGVTAGHNITEEAFGEIDLPLIHNTSFIQALNLSASGRYTQFKATRASDGATATDKNNWTYKVGANWQVNDFLRFRGSWGTSYRAPALFEQFLADQSAFVARRSVDPCINLGLNPSPNAILVANCAADGMGLNFTGGNNSSVEIVSGGGLGVVKAETSTAKTASVILTPKFGFLPSTRINLAVDYFNIEVKGEISKLGGSAIVSGCYLSNFFPGDPLCGQFDRDPTTHAITQIRDQYININSQKNEGIDVTANISQDLGNLGKLSVTAEMTWQTVDYVALYEGTRQNYNGEDGEPMWTGAFNASWEKGSFSIYYGLNVVGGTSDVGDWLEDNPATNGSLCTTSALYPGGYCEKLRAKPTFYHSLSITKELPHLQITLGVTNLFNTKPPRVSIYGNGEITTLGQSVFSSQYDMLGRRGFLSVKGRF
ncbi:TonB-dependent receptor [Sphingomonas sp. HITSZ_GF]|uniref:TonB-dependent receptor plug domain-containing protein n=1 Tax=Sphingomonas sp. HITSZ_GF TaxID=3037247 RepID=UPI00240DBCF1|nr:TonB-dependent receptor [Sphingomonas sp. HITSZ_GF]MDG2532450.1 TonB-dependent receptor [Sphingomonas sp. HITSZ_GF]